MWFETNTGDRNIDPEINSFLQNDWIIDSKEASLLLKEAENAKNNYLHVSAQELNRLRNAIRSNSTVWALSSTDKRILQDIIDNSASQLNKVKVAQDLGDVSKETEHLTRSTYLWSYWKLKNVNPVSLKTIVKTEQNQEIIALIWEEDKFSITDKRWRKFNVVWSDSRKDYVIEWTNRRAIIYDGYELWKYDSAIKPKERLWRNIELKPEEIRLLAALVKAEAGGESEKWQVAVIFALLNRIHFWKKPLQKVVYQPGQFSPVSDWRLASALNWWWLKSYKYLIAKVLSWQKSNPIKNATFFQSTDVERLKAGKWQRTASTLKNPPFVVWNHVFREEKKYSNGNIS